MADKAIQKLVVVAAVVEAAIMLAALALDGPHAMVAAVMGSAPAVSAQVLAVALLRPAMGAPQHVFQQRWVLGMAVRFASLLVLAGLMIGLKTMFPIAYMAVGYLGTMLVLLFAETRFLT